MARNEMAIATTANGRALLERVLAYEHSELVARLQRKMGLGPEEARELFRDNLRYLWLCATLRKRLAPSESIDECWHNFLLYTRDYAAFCNRFFGRFLHHSPTPTLAPAGDLPTRAQTTALAREHFGAISLNWTGGEEKASCDCGGSTNCQ